MCVTITVEEFLDLNLDNFIIFTVYDYAKKTDIYDSRVNDELPTEIAEMELHSFQIDENGVLMLNVDSEYEEL